MTARNSFTVSFKNECRELKEEYGQVELYAKLGAQKIAIVRPLSPISSTVLHPPRDDDADTLSVSVRGHFKDQGIFGSQLAMATRVAKADALTAINTDSITQKVVFVQTGDKKYYSSTIPNFVECDKLSLAPPTDLLLESEFVECGPDPEGGS